MKKIFLAISIGAFFLLFSLFLVVLSLQKPTPSTTLEIPTPTPVFPGNSSATSTLHVVNTTPKDNATQLSPQQTLQITFNKPLTTYDITATFTPPIQFSEDSQKNMLTLTPLENYEENVLYTLTIEDAQTQEVIATLHFSSGNSPTAAPMQDQNVKNDVDTFDKANQPDVFVANITPYQTKDFSVDTTYVDGTPYGHYGILVTVKTPSGKQNFLDWLTSLGLTDQQISTLDIQY